MKAASKSNNRKDHKDDLREHFHKQLKRIWDTSQLRSYKKFLRREPTMEGDFAILRPLNSFECAPLVSREVHAVSNIEIVTLRPEPEGQIFVRGGDIDNTLKSLLNALRTPIEEAALPSNTIPITAATLRSSKKRLSP